MPEKHKKQKRKPSKPAKPTLASKPSNDPAQAVPMVNLDAFLAEISTRLVTTGSVPLPQQQFDQMALQERLQIIVFALGTVRYAVEAGSVGEVVRSPEITYVPGLPDWVLGVTNLHGDIVSAVDLPLFLNISEHITDQPAYMLVAQAADQRIGLVVDGVDIIYTFPAEQVISPPFDVAPGLVPYMRGIIERQDELIRFLDCESLLLGSQMQQFS